MAAPPNPVIRPWAADPQWGSVSGSKSKDRFNYLSAYVKRNGGEPITPGGLLLDILHEGAEELWGIPTVKEEIVPAFQRMVLTSKLRAIRENLKDDPSSKPRSFRALVGFSYTFKVEKKGAVTQRAYWQAFPVLKDNKALLEVLIKRIQAVLDGYKKSLKNMKDYKIILSKSKY